LTIGTKLRLNGKILQQELAHLGVNALTVGRGPSVAVFRRHYAAEIRSKKTQSFQRPDFAAKFLRFAHHKAQVKETPGTPFD
jgi:hypothetical protein